jgi:uncharacterized protein (TIGR03067 family)
MNMKNILMTLFCSVGILAVGCAKSPQSDALALQGKWAGQEVGSQIPGASSLVIDGTNLEFVGADTNEWYKATFTLRDDTTPKQLVAVITDCPAPQYIGKTANAIYKIEDGKFTLTGNEPGNPAVPGSFDAPHARELVFTPVPKS